MPPAHPLSLAIGADHAGDSLRASVILHLRSLAEPITIHDIASQATEANASPGALDYIDAGKAVAALVAEGTCTVGIVICGTGIGVAMAAAANPAARVALCPNEYMARMARSHNDANVLCLGARVMGEALALGVIDVFLQTPFSGGRHAARLAKLALLRDR